MRRVALGALAALALSGCASQGVVIHRMPDQTPAADNAAKVAKVEALAKTQGEAAAAQENADQFRPPVTPADAPSMRTYDPWERFNRFNYRFNTRFDENVFLPVSNGYRRLPSPLRAGVHHFFGNLSEIDTMVNYALQGRLHRGVRSFGRFVINSTVGIGGLFDPATRFGLARAPTGFGTTLSIWGMHPGPYLVIPILGPSTLREAVGLLGDYGTTYGINIANLYRGDASWGLGPVNAVDTRANVSFRYYSSGSPFDYDDIRFLYVRKLLLEDEGLHKKSQHDTSTPAAPAGQ